MPTETMNFEVDGLCRRIRRFKKETVKATSSGAAFTTEADMTRARAYLDAIEFYLDHIASQPPLDLPETHPTMYVLDDEPELEMPENEALVDLSRMWNRFEGEIANSQTSRMASGIISHDEKRCRDIIAKARGFLDNYIASVQPLDLPETAPARASTGPGRTGV